MHIDRTTKALIAGLMLALLGSGVALVPRLRGADASLTPTSEVGDGAASPLRIELDASLEPPDPIEGVHDGDQARPLGRLVNDDGVTSDIVRDELVISGATDEQLAALLARFPGEVVDSGEGEHLVRLSASADKPDAAAIAAGLSSVEPHHGRLGVSDEATLYLLGVAAIATNELGLDVAPNPISGVTSIADGEVAESDDLSNPFGWSWFSATRPQGVGIGEAWQLLQSQGKLSLRVKAMVHDGGFVHTFDHDVDTARIRKADWGDKGRWCGRGDGAGCDYHGTDTSLTMAALVDNGYGVAGPAGPVAEMVLTAAYSDRWKSLRKLEEVVTEERPRVINMSYSSNTTVFRNATEQTADKRYERMATNALLVAAAGNDGRNVDTQTCVAGNCGENVLILPCESRHVLCVGGLSRDSTARAGDSNYGEFDNPRSVEIWGPMCTRSINDANAMALDFTTRRVCGTSFASPIVAGVAALVLAANPGLSPAGLREVLARTAHEGVQGTWISSSMRRINALGAVSAALGVKVEAPTVEIIAPTAGAKLTVASTPQLRGKATDFAGAELPIAWTSSLDGDLSDGPVGGIVPVDKLSAGRHVITATAVDSLGAEGKATVTVDVVDAEPKLKVLSPAAGRVYLASQSVELSGSALDPDTWTQVPADELRWQVKRSGGGAAVFVATGPKAMVSGGKLADGRYEVVFSTTSGATAGVVEFSVKAPVPGDEPPTARILAPTGSPYVVYGTEQGGFAKVQLRGRGDDAKDGSLSGTRMRWTAVSADTAKVLCAGSGVPGTGQAGGLAGTGSCATVNVELPALLGEASPWRIELEVFDSAGQPDLDSVDIEVRNAVG